MKKTFPLSYAQQRLWFLSELNPDSAFHNIPAAVKLSGSLNVEALRKAIDEVVGRHEVLRTVFISEQGRPAQVINEAGPVNLRIEDISPLSHEQRKAAIERRMSEEAESPFDLAAGPLLRVRLLRLEPEQHVLMFTVHHIISDGWSTGVMIRELGALYEAYSEGRESPLPELEIQYVDYAVWQRERLQANVLETQMEYWRGQLANAPVLSLPTDKPRPAAQSFQGAREYLRFGEEMMKQLKEFSQREGVTLYMALLAGFQVLLQRYSGQDEIVVGSPIAGRTRAELEPLIGFFVNTLVLRTDLSGDPTVRELLGRVREVCLGAYAHQELPFEQLVDELQPERDPSRNPLFQVMFALQTHTPQTFLRAGLEISLITVKKTIAAFDLSLLLKKTASGAECMLEYSTSLFEAEAIRRMMRQYQRVLEWMAANPEQRISRLALLSGAERKRALYDWNSTSTDYGADRCLHEIISEQSRASPGTVAVIFEGERLSYRQLDEQANQLAHYLSNLGVGAESRVGLLMERSLDLVAAMLGVLKAGGAYVPIDVSNPKQRIEYALADAGVEVVIADERMREVVEGKARRVVSMGGEREQIAGESKQEPVLRVGRDNAAYVIYTSGSTGRPKGVINTHGGIVNRLRWMQEAFGLKGEDRVLQKTPYSFDVSVWEFFWPLMYGAGLVLARAEGEKDPEYLGEVIEGEKITTMHFVPSMLQVFVRSEGVKRCGSLRRVMSSGEKLSAELEEEYYKRMGAELHNLYGPTEAAVDVSWWACERGEGTRAAPIGKPIANTQLYVMDGQMEPVPVGVAGELYISGKGLARGYLGRPGLTSERFLPNPNSQEAGARMYRTGDLARYRADGNIEYVGRIDHQVKVRGYRIELGEIESVLLQHEGIREAVVLVSGEQEKRLTAYLVSKEERVEISKLREYVRQSLPEYMVPSGYVWLEKMPVTANGKLDRAALREADQAEVGREKEYVAPRGPVEELLAGIWSQVLAVDRVGIHDNFFELGGDSILTIQMISKLKQIGFNVSLAAFFQHRTIESLGQYLQEMGQGSETQAQVLPFSLISEADRQKLASDIEDAYPLTMLQTGMLFHSEYLPDSPTYHDIVTFHIRAPFDEQALRLSLDRLAERHPVLRTSFDLSEFSRPLQLVHASAGIPMSFDDLRGLPGSEQDHNIRLWIEEEKKVRFDWTHPPLLRVQAHQRSDDTFQFSLALHHSILDGWSIATMLTELFQSYVAALKGDQIATPPLKASFRDYVAQELRVIESPDAQLYWTERLSDLQVRLLSQPYSGEQELSADVQIETLIVPIAQSTCKGLRKLARTAGVSLKTVLLAAHLRTIGFHLGQSDVLTGLVTNSRPETNDGENVLGLFLNTVPFRLNTQGGTWSDLIQEVLATEIDLMPYRSYPLGLLQRNNGNRPLFDTVFNYVHFHVYNDIQNIPGVEVIDGNFFEQTNFPLAATFSCDLSSSDIELTLGYDAGRFERDYIDGLMETYCRVLDLMAADPSSHYDAQSLLTPAESDRILREWNDTDALDVRPRCLDEMFVAQAGRTRNATALVCGNKQITYEELNRRSNQLAHYLRQLGVRPEVVVAVCMERSVDLMIALLGVMKAGGVYLPLDPQYPRERLEFMLSDSQALLLLTHKRLLERLSGFRGRVIRVDRDSDAIESQSDLNPPQTKAIENTAYVIYTSGSTGTPKGVLVSHRGMANVVESQRRLIAPIVPEKVLQFSSLSFDAFVFEVLLSLPNGATLCMGPPGALLQGTALSDFLKEQAITTVVLPPSVLAGVPVEDLPALQTILVAGEPCPEDLPRQFARGRQFFNLYGPTETTIWTTAARCSEDLERVSIGRPILNTRTYILGSDLQPVPAGVPGELCIAGVGLATAYMNRADLTAEKFSPNPHSQDAGARMYRTGDLARYMAYGNIEFLGRIDHQVKIRGYRVELGEIESVLLRHEAISEAVVVARKDQKLVAYVVSGSGERVGVSELREYLSQSMPEYMVPSGYVWMEKMPLTANGKLDRSALPDLEQVRPEIDRPYVAPQSELEKTIALIWRDVLQLDKVGVQDNFFDLGGHSLNMLQIQTKLQTQLNRQISIAELFQFPTVSSLAKQFSQSNDALLPQLQSNTRGEKRRASTQARREFRVRTKQA